MKIRLSFLIALVMLLFLRVASSQSLLTAKPWHLYQKTRDGKKSLLHKPSDNNFIFIFYPNGKMILQRNHGKEDLGYTWKWEDSQHKTLYTQKDNDSLGRVLRLTVKELSKTRLIVYVKGKQGENIYEFHFRHADDPLWLKEDIDGMNAARKDPVLPESVEPKP